MNNNAFRSYKTRTLTRDLAIGLASVITVTILLIGVVVYAFAVTKTQQDLERQSRETTDHLAAILSLPVWTLDKNSIKQIADTYRNIENVTGILVWDHQGNALYQEAPLTKYRLISAQKPIYYENKLIGSVQVSISTENITTASRNILGTTFATVFLVVLVELVAVNFLLQKFLDRPLAELGRGIGSIANGNYAHELMRAPQAEIDQIIQQVNNMAGQIAEREAALRKSEARYANLLINLEAGIIVHAPDTTIVMNNSRAEEILGISNEQMIGKMVIDPVWKFVDENKTPLPIDEYPVNRILTSKNPIKNQTLGIYQPGKIDLVWVAVNGFPVLDNTGEVIEIVISVTDITLRKVAENKLHEYSEHLEAMVDDRTRELREMQELLVRKEKLAVLGQLASGVAHELRNPLVVISNAIYYLKLIRSDVDEKTGQYFGIIEQEVRNAEKIVTDLLDYARTISVDREPVSVTEIVANVLTRHPAPSSVEIIQELPVDLPKVYVDLRQLELVLGHLVLNAYQAMALPPAQELPGAATLSAGGKLTLSAKRKGLMAAIAITDTGTGITTENIKKIFEPLFTTKIKGIGMGLALSKKIIEANDGRIEVQSESGKGSTFTVYLPIHINN
jgi:PAS domain S-box-containing protein